MPIGVYNHKKLSLETKQKISEAHKGKSKPWLRGNTNAQKENPSYSAIHHWIDTQLERPNTCENCNGLAGGKRIEWANISGEYLRDTSDWAALCSICHNMFDTAYRSKVLPKYVASMVGKRFNQLTVLDYVDKGMWLFKCDCGNEKVIRKAHVNSGKTKSCGCYRKIFMNEIEKNDRYL